jgi:hypothetical protein
VRPVNSARDHGFVIVKKSANPRGQNAFSPQAVNCTLAANLLTYFCEIEDFPIRGGLSSNRREH